MSTVSLLEGCLELIKTAHFKSSREGAVRNMPRMDQSRAKRVQSRAKRVQSRVILGSNEANPGPF